MFKAKAVTTCDRDPIVFFADRAIEIQPDKGVVVVCKEITDTKNILIRLIDEELTQFRTLKVGDMVISRDYLPDSDQIVYYNYNILDEEEFDLLVEHEFL